jgi:hypothetical protein
VIFRKTCNSASTAALWPPRLCSAVQPMSTTATDEGGKRTTPSAVTRYVSGSTVISGSESLCFRSRLVTVRHPLTASIFLRSL